MWPNTDRTARELEAAYRALDYSQVPGNKMPTQEQLRLIRNDIATTAPRDKRDAESQLSQLAWLDERITS